MSTRIRRRRCWICGLSWPSTPGAARRCPSSSRAWPRCAARRACARTCSRSPARSSASSCTSSTASASRRRRSGATARSRRAVGERPGYFPPGADVFVAHPPTGLEGLHGGRGRYLFTVSRLDAPKRIDLLIARDGAGQRATSSCGSPAPAPRRRGCASWRPATARITFCGRVGDAELAELYAGARAVAFIPHARGLRPRHARGDARGQAGDHLHRLGRHRGARHATA